MMGLDIELLSLDQNDKVTVDINGNKVVCDILMTFDCDELSKRYIVFTDNNKGENGNDNIFALGANILIDESKYENITDPDEMEMVQDAIAYASENGKFVM